MKHFFTFISCLILSTQFSIAQDGLIKKKLYYKITVVDKQKTTTKGYLATIKDTTVQISPVPVRLAYGTGNLKSITQKGYGQIEEISLKRKGGAGRGAWKGAVVGVLIGVAAGFIEGDDAPCVYDTNNPFDYSWCTATNTSATEKAALYGLLGGTAGSGIGALLGAVLKKKFIIGGNEEKFDAMKANVLNKAYGIKASTNN